MVHVILPPPLIVLMKAVVFFPLPTLHIILPAAIVRVAAVGEDEDAAAVAHVGGEVAGVGRAARPGLGAEALADVRAGEPLPIILTPILKILYLTVLHITQRKLKNSIPLKFPLQPLQLLYHRILVFRLFFWLGVAFIRHIWEGDEADSA